MLVVDNHAILSQCICIHLFYFYIWGIYRSIRQAFLNVKHSTAIFEFVKILVCSKLSKIVISQKHKLNEVILVLVPMAKYI